MEKVTATARRDGKWWVFEVPELSVQGPAGESGVVTGQARTLKDLEREVRDVVALLLGVEDFTGEVAIEVGLPAEVMEMWERANDQDARAREEARRAAVLRRDAVRTLTDAKGYRISQQDIAQALGVSPQRVSQLVR